MYIRKTSIQLVAFTSMVALLAVMPATLAGADSNSIDFESYAVGTVNGQDGWSSFGAAGSGCAVYDHGVVAQATYSSFGTKSLRMSNAVTSGCFGDQTFSKSLVDAAGETTAQGGSMSSGPVQDYFEAQWQFASTTGSPQPGLSVVASPDRGDGARMSWVQMRDTATGLEVNFFDYQSGEGFVHTNVASGLDRTVPHTIKITMTFVNGVQNDVVKVYVDGVLGHVGTSWEDYFREEEGNPTRTVDSILFRTGGPAAPSTTGQGFYIDNLNLISGSFPANKDECKNGGWKTFNRPAFANQGDCVSWVATNGRNPANG